MHFPGVHSTPFFITDRNSILWSYCASRTLVLGCGLISWSRLVGCRLVIGMPSFALVSDLSVEPIVMIGDVFDGLDTAVGQSHCVRALSVVTVALLVLGEVGAGVVVVYGVVEGVRPGLVLVLGLRVVGGRLVGRSGAVGRWAVRSWGTSGNGQDGGNDECLENMRSLVLQLCVTDKLIHI